jgi:hypothetical protein
MAGTVRMISIAIDAIPGAELLINDRLGMRVKHPGCDTLGYLIVASDVIYCLRCDFKARPSELWPAEVEVAPAARPNWHQLRM